MLKQHGITFNQAVCSTCACTPSRNCTFTGTYPTKNLSNFTLTEFYLPTHANSTPYNIPGYVAADPLPNGPYPTELSSSEVELDQTLPNLATVLAEAGYETYYKGKYHLCKGVLGYDNNYVEVDATRYGFKRWDPPDAGQDAQIQNYGGGTADNDGRFTQDTVAFLQARAADPDRANKPFCLVFSLVNPHDVLGFPGNWTSPTSNGGYEIDSLCGDIQLPPTIDEDLTTNFKPTSQAAWLAAMGSLTDWYRRAYLNFYGNLMKQADDQIMLVLDALRDGGLWSDTLVIRASDHGEMGLTHGGMRQKWFNVYQESMKVPLVWSNPVMFPRPLQSDALVGLVDLLPTIASVAGVQDISRFGFQGRDYSSLFTNPKGKVQDYTYFVNTDIKAGQKVPMAVAPPNKIVMVRDAQYKYARYYGGNNPNTTNGTQEEFYNLATDVDPGTQDALELQNKSNWAYSLNPPATWPITDEEKAKRTEMEDLLRTATTTGILAPVTRTIPPRAMSPRAKTVANAPWATPIATTAEVYQVICYTQVGYTYALQYDNAGTWTDCPRTTTAIRTTLAGNNGPMLFQAQPAQATPPAYRVARTAPDGTITYESVTWTNYTEA